MKPLIHFKQIPILLTTLASLCCEVLPVAQAVVPAPDGGYPGFNTAEGQNALFNLTTGVANTGNGWYSLFSNTDGSYNTAVGAGTLLFNIGDQSTGAGTENTALGSVALLNNSSGKQNTAVGSQALFSNTTGGRNTASGPRALYSNTDGERNTAIGYSALEINSTGYSNTAVGHHALGANVVGLFNTALGNEAGSAITGAGNVCIGSVITGQAGVNNTTWIRNAYTGMATGRAVYADSDNKIGTLSSSRRYKENIKPMDKASETLFALKPVIFRYKKQIDVSQVPCFGLIAEEVADVSPDLITRDEQGKPQTVRYDAVNAMLLNEFLKEHRKNEEQGATIARLEKQLETVTATLQKVSAQLELNKPAPQTVRNDQ